MQKTVQGDASAEKKVRFAHSKSEPPQLRQDLKRSREERLLNLIFQLSDITTRSARLTTPK